MRSSSKSNTTRQLAARLLLFTGLMAGIGCAQSIEAPEDLPEADLVIERIEHAIELGQPMSAALAAAQSWREASPSVLVPGGLCLEGEDFVGVYADRDGLVPAGPSDPILAVKPASPLHQACFQATSLDTLKTLFTLAKLAWLSRFNQA